MSDNDRWNPWKMTAIAMALVVATAVITGIVVANLTGEREVKPLVKAPAVRSSALPRTAALPSQTDIDACNAYAKQQAGDKVLEVVKDAAIGGAVGAGVGAAGGAIADGGKGAGKGAAIGGVAGATAGTLYGLNENRKHDARYQEAYRTCMRQRGFTN